jgi:hypothetical protein
MLNGTDTNNRAFTTHTVQHTSVLSDNDARSSAKQPIKPTRDVTNPAADARDAMVEGDIRLLCTKQFALTPGTFQNDGYR